MRRNLYNKNVSVFLEALESLGWREITRDRRLPRDFKFGPFHLILKSRKAGYYCIIHKDRYLRGRHIRPICKSVELIDIFKEIIARYKKLRCNSSGQCGDSEHCPHCGSSELGRPYVSGLRFCKDCGRNVSN